MPWPSPSPDLNPFFFFFLKDLLWQELDQIWLLPASLAAPCRVTVYRRGEASNRQLWIVWSTPSQLEGDILSENAFDCSLRFSLYRRMKNYCYRPQIPKFDDFVSSFTLWNVLLKQKLVTLIWRKKMIKSPPPPLSINMYKDRGLCKNACRATCQRGKESGINRPVFWGRLLRCEDQNAATSLKTTCSEYTYPIWKLFFFSFLLLPTIRAGSSAGWDDQISRANVLQR